MSTRSSVVRLDMTMRCRVTGSFPVVAGRLPAEPPVHVAMARDRGGHFAPAEEPASFVEDVRATFRSLR